MRSSASSSPTARRIRRSKPLRFSSFIGREVLRHGLVVIDLRRQAVERQRVADDRRTSRARRRGDACDPRRRRRRGTRAAIRAARTARAIAAASGMRRQRRMKHLADPRVGGEKRGDARGGRRAPRVRLRRRRRTTRRSPRRAASRGCRRASPSDPSPRCRTACRAWRCSPRGRDRCRRAPWCRSPITTSTP